jgi:hypothetical protein
VPGGRAATHRGICLTSSSVAAAGAWLRNISFVLYIAVMFVVLRAAIARQAEEEGPEAGRDSAAEPIADSAK